MSRISVTKRKMQISQRRHRSEKLGKLRAKYTKTESEMEKEKILEKAGRVAPWLTEKEFLAPADKK